MKRGMPSGAQTPDGIIFLLALIFSKAPPRYPPHHGAHWAYTGFRPFQGRISLHAEFYPPDRRRRDLDNVGGKVLLDTLQAAGLFKDDSQIKRILLEMHEPVEGGLCYVKLEDMENAESQN